MSIPFICQTATTQDPAASPNVVVSAAAVAALRFLVVAAGVVSKAFVGFSFTAKAELNR
jgi:hypothetical protein